MSGLFLVVRAEGYRLLHARSTWVGGVFLAIVAVLRVLAARAAEAAASAEAVAAGRSIAGVSAGTAWAPFVEGWRAGLAAGTLLLLIHAAGTLAADRESGVLRLSLTRSSTRIALVFARALLAVPAVLLAVLATAAAAYVASAAFYEFGPLTEDGYELMSVAELRHELLLAGTAVIPPLIAAYAFGLCVSASSRRAVAAVGVTLALFLGFDLFKEVLGPGQYWIFASFTPSLVDGSAMQEMAGLARGYSDAGFSEGLMRMNLMVPWPEALVLVLLAGWIFSRKSL